MTTSIDYNGHQERPRMWFQIPALGRQRHARRLHCVVAVSDTWGPIVQHGKFNMIGQYSAPTQGHEKGL